MKKVGILINNIGTPASAAPADVASYLREFLMDPDVISLPRPWRDLLVKGVIAPLRAKSSAIKYQKIWLQEGSPLLVYSQKFAQELQSYLGEGYVVRIGMSYGSPNLAVSFRELCQLQVSEIIFAPMFPQWAEATTAAAYKAIDRLAQGQVRLRKMPPFFAQTFFLAPQAELMSSRLRQRPVDHLLFSYHSLPLAQVRKQPGCLAGPPADSACCEQPTAASKPCYRAQCVATSQLLRARLSAELQKIPSSTSFQSRLGPARWLSPTTAEEIARLAQSGVRRLAVVCPSFVADCLETAEEIAIEMRSLFLAQGGREFEQVPCVNAEANWIAGFGEEVRSLSTSKEIAV
jgi:ferrochelatase